MSTMARRPRRRFSPEFKAETVKLVRESGKTVGQVAEELDLTKTALRYWVRQKGKLEPVNEFRRPRTTAQCG